MTQQDMTAVPTVLVQVTLPVLVPVLGLAYRTEALALFQTVETKTVTILVPQPATQSSS
jgi:hypothetical protein